MSTSTRVEVVVVIGAGSIGQAIARRIGVAKTILLGDVNEATAVAAANTLQAAGFNTSTATVDVASHDSVRTLANTATALGGVVHVVHTAGLSRRRPHPKQSSPSTWSAWRSSWKSSVASSRRAAPGSSSPAKPDI